LAQLAYLAQVSKQQTVPLGARFEIALPAA
jgi:hypothetical protein